MEYVLQTDSLTKIYGHTKVVNAVNMHVEKGSIYGFIGKKRRRKNNVYAYGCRACITKRRLYDTVWL